MPGTLRDSLFILDTIHARDGGPKPETVITDTASCSDIVFGLFAICGYQFSPRIADISDARLWHTNTAADYGPLQPISKHTVRLDRVRAHWGDMLRVASSPTLGEVRGYDPICMLSPDGRPTGLGDAFAATAVSSRLSTCSSSSLTSSIRRASSATTLGADSTSSPPSRQENRGARPIPVLRTFVARKATWLYGSAGFSVSSR
ncbi:Tn3 family transposase [Streptomyces sp. 5-10]|uniref:Tn3 family transposase n=1 Tax=Streptomyces sp. 5-10 TaxID=878925 RepID=UPI00168A78FE|nr:Tn3 family transposase [Streptomyces sp. 5-10]